MNFTAFVFARGGSKGLPGKNIMPLAGTPLIGWAIEQALAVPFVERVIVSTDSEEIADVAKNHGAEIPFLRPAALASDSASEWDAWEHAIRYFEKQEGKLPDPFISVPTTSPLRYSSDVSACLEEYSKGKADMVIAVTEAHRNPWFNMVCAQNNGTMMPVNSNKNTFSRRQDAPTVYDMTTLAYVANPRYVLESQGIFSGDVRAVHVPIERAIDVDTQFDFDMADFLMRKRLGQL